MNEAHLHLALNHLPIIIPFIGLIVLISAFLVKSEIVKRCAFFIFILGALFTFPSFLTGEGAEEMVEDIQGITHDIIHKHEEIAETFVFLSYSLGALSILAVWANWKRKTFSNWIAISVLLVSVVVLFFAKKTGATGGEIRHEEIRNEK
jgi:uncharacterized membrane protein